MRQLIVWIATWLAIVVPSGIQQAGSETEAVIRSAVDQRFALMPESWRAEFSRRLAGRIDDPRVAAPTRVAILKECDSLMDLETIPLMLIEHAASFFPAAAPPEELLHEGSRDCAVAIEAVIKNIVLYAPLSEAEKAARRSDLKGLERQALRILDERIVGDDRARSVVAARVAGLFQQYEGEIEKPTSMFLNRALPPGTFQEIVEGLEKTFPREKTYLLSGLSGDPDADAKKLQDQGIDDLIMAVVVTNVYGPVLRASWADQAALKDYKAAADRLQQWRERTREAIRVKAVEQKIESDKLRALLDPPSRVPRPVTRREDVPSPGPPAGRKDTPTVPDGMSSTPAPAPGARWPIVIAAAALVAGLVLLRWNRRKSA